MKLLTLPCRFLVFIALLLPGTAAAEGRVDINQFSPTGSVKAPRQVTARFSAAMVPFGDPVETAPPFEIDCPAKGSGRWIDSTTWVFDFEADLPAGLHCTFRPRADLRGLDGEVVAAARVFLFDTGAPAVVRSLPEAGATTVEENQVFLLGLDGEVDLASVREHATFVVEGLREPIEADILDEKELDALLEDLDEWARPEPPRIALRARRAFPNDTAVTLEWAAGIRSASTIGKGIAAATAQTFPFRTRARFSVDAACRRENPRFGCLPITPITVRFSAPVANAQALALRLVGPDEKEREPEPLDEDTRAQGSTSEVVFRGPFAADTTFSVRLPAELRDDAGRALPDEQATTLTVKTGPVPVLAKFASRFGLLERNADPALAVTLRNIEESVAGTRALAVPPAAAVPVPPLAVQGSGLRVKDTTPAGIFRWLRLVAAAGRSKSIFDGAAATAGSGVRNDFVLPKARPSVDTEVVGIPLAGPGLHVVELSSPLLGAALLGDERRMFVAAAALVTNLAVHFKHGSQSSLAWVTTLDEARPVAGAEVSVADCTGAVLATATTGDDGVARFPSLPKEPPGWSECHREPMGVSEDDRAWSERYSTPAFAGLDSGGLLVVARKDDDMSFVHTSWERGIETWRFQLPRGGWWAGPVRSHTVFDRSLYRQGETVHMKHILRERVMTGFTVPTGAARPVVAALEHVGSGQRIEMPIAFDDAGVATGQWAVPAAARLGSWSVSMKDPTDEDSSRWIPSGSFRVEQFRVPLLRGEVGAPAVVASRAASVEVDVSVQHLSGGPASGLPVLLRSQLRPGAFAAPEEYDGFVFASAPVRAGLDNEEEVEGGARPHGVVELKLDAAGGARTIVGDLPLVDRPTNLVLEAEFRDANGEVQTVATTRTLLPSSLVAGIRVEDWAGADADLEPRVVVVDAAGKPTAGVPVRIEAFRRDWFSYRRRLVGGFYGYVHTSEIRRVATLCEGTSDAAGTFTCSRKPPESGNLLLEAVVTDAGGHASHASVDAWVPGAESGFASEPGDRIDLVAEKPFYEPGETARFQVRMPFRQATALVTVEREGVGEARVVQLGADNPVIEVPVASEHAPNVFVSALVVRGRVGDVQPTAFVDLGRPACKFGVAELRVQPASQRLAVTITSDRETYRVRENAKVRVAVRRADGSAPPAGSEVAVAAVDEGLLELAPNGSWDLLDGMMGRRTWDVETSTAQLEVTGRRHYGLKAVPAGGGGGRSPTRELFDTLLLWSPRVALDERGEATLDVPLNDSLTAFRLVAVATAGAGEFGTGSRTIRSTRELSMLPGVAPLVREGDRVTTEFTVRNTGSLALAVTASGKVDGTDLVLEPRRVYLAPGEGRVVEWPVVVPAGRPELVYEMTATAVAAIDLGAESVPAGNDSLRVRQRVVPAQRVEVTQATLEQLEGSLRVPVRIPSGADPAAAGSGVFVHAAPSLAASVAPVKEWLAAYRYTCLEQRVSMAVGSEDATAWQAVVDGLEAHVDDNGLLRYYPGKLPGDDKLTAYVLSISQAAGLALPAELADRMAGGLRSFVDGRIPSGAMAGLPDLTLRKLAAVAALARLGKADAAMLAGITVQPALWPTSALLDWWTIVLRVPVGDAASRRAEVENLVRARLDLSGTTLEFSGPGWQQAPWWMMASPDSNATRLLHLLAEQKLWRRDAARLLTGVVARRKGGAWQTTIANAWGVLAMRRFAESFEGEAVSGRTHLALAAAMASFDWKGGPPAGATLPWPRGDAELLVRHEGEGRPWITTTARAAVPRTEPVSAGYRLRKTVTLVKDDPTTEAGSGNARRRGDRLHVRIDIEAQRVMWQVVVDDPIPAGASHLGTGLGRGAGTEPAATTGTEDAASPLHPDYVERSHESWRGYLQYLPAGPSRVEYDIRLNQAGTFHLPATRIEALYAPEIFGELPNAVVTVEP